MATAPTSIGYNERAWAIDVISEINRYLEPRTRALARAGGEHTLRGSGAETSLFPDVLLFGDHAGSMVQQGWELKMPDTSINDLVLLENAEKKANRLGLDSFVVWNADTAVLYKKTADGDFAHAKAWPSSNLKTRAEVAGNRAAWTALLHRILDDVNDLLDYGEISGRRPEKVIGDSLFLDYLNLYAEGLSKKIEGACQSDSGLDSNLIIWWLDNKQEHPGSTRFQAISRVNLINWINRFLFFHYLRCYHSPASNVDSIQPGSTVRQAIDVFDEISRSCDFMNIFHPEIGQEHIDAATWAGLVELNGLLKDFKLETLGQSSLHAIIEGALSYSRKKLAGQFSTPKPLADLLVRLAIKDRTRPVVDPCCGTGTIVRAAYDLKRKVGLGVAESLESLWASDKFSFPLQLCSIALSDPQGMGEVVQVFKADAFRLEVGNPVEFTDPDSGETTERTLPKMHALVSNLPFVSFNKINALNPIIRKSHSDGLVLSNRADLYAHLILKLQALVEEGGQTGVICSNSWLGADWGESFKKILLNRFQLKQVVVSGQGRWFGNADIVATMLVLENRPPKHGGAISFITTDQRIEDWAALSDGIDGLGARMVVQSENKDFTVQKHKIDRIGKMEDIGLGWNALFVNLDWVDAIAPNLVPAHTCFRIARGERRGWNPMFYPGANHGIEARHVKKVLKSSRNIRRLVATPDDEAFCCSAGIEELKSKKDSGALRWIKHFESATNQSGKPLPEVLARPNCHWYEMSPATLADFVLSMNPDRRLCIHRLEERSFVDQRLIRFSHAGDRQTDPDLCHALLNSAVGMFLIEAIGFGRGLGALDLNATKLSRKFHMLDPGRLSKKQRSSIIEAFSPLLARGVLGLPEELQQEDRIYFDGIVLDAYGIAGFQDQIYKSLGRLFHIRQTARS